MEARTTDFGPHVRTLNSLGLWVLARHRGSSPAVIDERETREHRRLVAARTTGAVGPTPIRSGPYLEALAAVRLGLRDPEEVEASARRRRRLRRAVPAVSRAPGGQAGRRLRRADLQRDRDAAPRRRVPSRHAAVVPPPARRRVPGSDAGPRADDPAAQPPRARRVRGRRRRPVHLRPCRRRPGVPDRLRPAVSGRGSPPAAGQLSLSGRGRHRRGDAARLQPPTRRQGDRARPGQRRRRRHAPRRRARAPTTRPPPPCPSSRSGLPSPVSSPSRSRCCPASTRCSSRRTSRCTTPACRCGRC